MANDEINRAILNNIKYNKNDKDINTLIDITSSAYQEVNDSVTSCQASPQGATPQEERGVGSSPNQPWGYLKLDLFDNATSAQQVENERHFHAKLSVKRHDNPNWLYASAGLNSERRMAKRGLNLSKPADAEHWATIQTVYATMREDYADVRVSKFYQAGSQKGKTIKGLSVVIGEDSKVGEYAGVVIKGTECYAMQLSGDNLSSLQRKKHIVASGEWKDGQGSSSELNVDDWLRG